jgi:class 3 adenylate cyclase
LFALNVRSAFDKCAKKFRVYKVETISDSYMVASGVLDSYMVSSGVPDSYMVASGVPRRIGHDHAAEIALMALDMMAASSAFSLPGHTGEPLPLRIGANSGRSARLCLSRQAYSMKNNAVGKLKEYEKIGPSVRCGEDE